MRTIKFRAISLCKGEKWVYGDLRHYNRNPRREKWTIHDPENGIETDIDENTIGEFTGLYDKNGKEIYEGDIVSIETIKSRINKVVEWNKEMACFDAVGEGRIELYTFYKCEVIGNIHDRKEETKCP